MAAEGTAVADPVSSPASTGGTAPDPHPSTSVGVKAPATSQPEYKWEDDTRTRAMREDLQKERKTRQEHADAVAAQKAEAEQWRQKALALSGLQPQDPKLADAESIRAKILELMPELADVSSIADMKAALEEQQVQGYAAHSKTMIAQIYKAIAAEYGELTDSQKRRINAAYVYENQANPEIHARHNAGDPALIAEFSKAFIDDMVEPIRKKTAASEASRFRPVPGGRDRSTPIKGEQPKTGADMLRAHFREKTRQG